MLMKEGLFILNCKTTGLLKHIVKVLNHAEELLLQEKSNNNTIGHKVNDERVLLKK